MKIIVIGMDNSGKTTLVKNLSEALDLESIVSCGPKPKHEQVEWTMTQLGKQRVVFDRFTVLEEMVYGPKLRSKSNFEINDFLVQVIKKEGCILVYARPDKGTIMNFGEREQMEGVIENAEDLIRRYDSLVWDLVMDGFTVIPYNYKGQTLGSLVEALTMVYSQLNNIETKGEK